MHLCLSGGADGADLEFGRIAGLAGHSVLHWSFENARTQAPRDELVILTPEQLGLADQFLVQANKTLDRRIPFGRPVVINLLRRNWYQVKDSESVYGVSRIKNGRVQGGTAWAVQMFIDQHGGATCPCYIFDQITRRWYTWVCTPREVPMHDDPLIASQTIWKGRWQPIEAPPPPRGVYAGIGSRELLPNGKAAIRGLYGNVPVKVLLTPQE